jgi:hypothetical protein
VEPAGLPSSPAVRRRIEALRERFRAAPSPSRARDRSRIEVEPRPVVGVGVAASFGAEAGGVRAVLPASAERGVRRPALVELPLRAGGFARLEDRTSHLHVRFALRDAADVPVAVADGIALYEGALGGADLVHRVYPEGTEDYVVFERRPARESLAYDVDVSGVGGLRLVANTLEFVDEAGSPRLRVAPPYVVDSRGARHAATLDVDGCAYDASPAPPWGRAVTRPAAPRCTVRVAWEGDVAYPALVDPVWSATGSMATPRSNHTGSLLGSGKVLVAGGSTSTAELYDPATGVFGATGAMAEARSNHTASVLGSGDVLVAGGAGAVTLSSADLYDPATGVFTAAGSMGGARARHTASVLASGKVFVAGGGDDLGAVSTAELFDPSTGTFAPAASLVFGAREDHTASVVASGDVYLCGGADAAGPLNSSEIYLAATGTYTTPFGTLGGARTRHRASVLATGEVLISGGRYFSSWLTSFLYNPVPRTITSVGNTNVARDSHTATLLESGKVLIAGGFNDFNPALASAELYDPVARIFAVTASLGVARREHTATLLDSGSVLVTGGKGPADLTSAEIFVLAAAGDPCAVADDCGSGVCNGGVCCAGPCGGVCKTCAPLTGACVTVTLAQDPDTCAGSNECDANGKCKLKDAEPCVSGSLCASGFCADGSCCNTACGPCGDCSAPQPGACAVKPAHQAPTPSFACGAFLCDGVSATCPAACAVDADCGAAAFCAGGTCTGKLPQGTPCASGGSCLTGHCVDGFCCDDSCGGQCQACGEAGSLGVCKTVAGAPRAPRVACLGSGSCQGTCDGGNPIGCVFPGAGTACGPASSCIGDVAQPEGACDGSGSCAIPGTKACAPYTCDALTGVCTTSCTSSADCTQGVPCDTASGKCAPGLASCADLFTILTADGQLVSCAPYTCLNGACLGRCVTTNDCVHGYACEGATCVQQGGAGGGPSSGSTGTGGTGPPMDGGGCACRAAAHDGDARGLAAVIAASLAAAGARRRRSSTQAERRLAR